MKHIKQYQVTTSYLLIHLTDGSELLIYFNQNSGKSYARRKIGTLSNIQHAGIFIGLDSTGEQWWIHNHYHIGTAVLATDSEFRQGMPIHIYNISCENAAIDRIRKAMYHVVRSETYKPLTYNCQTLVNDVCNNKRESADANRLVGNAFLGLGLIAILALVSSD